MCHTAYGNEFIGKGELTHEGGGVMPMIAVSDNLITWGPLSQIVRGEDNKDLVLFPRHKETIFTSVMVRFPHGEPLVAFAMAGVWSKSSGVDGMFVCERCGGSDQQNQFAGSLRDKLGNMLLHFGRMDW